MKQPNFSQRLLRWKKKLFLKAAKISGLIITEEKISVDSTTGMISLLNMTTRSYRDLKKVLKNTGVGDFLPSEGKIKTHQIEQTKSLSAALYIVLLIRIKICVDFGLTTDCLFQTC